MSIINSSIENLKKVKYGFRGGWQSIKDINSRSGLSIFDYTELMKPLDFYPFVPHKENNLYGNGSVIQASFPHLDFSETTIEHGCILVVLFPHAILKVDLRISLLFQSIEKNLLALRQSKISLLLVPTLTIQSLSMTLKSYCQRKINWEKLWLFSLPILLIVYMLITILQSSLSTLKFLRKNIVLTQS